MSHCSHCNQLVDKYTEYDFVIIIIDLILHKSEVYRHLIFNRMSAYDTGIDYNTIKVGMLVLFCDSYVKFARMRAVPCGATAQDIASAGPQMHLGSPFEVFDRDMVYCLAISILQLLLYLAGTLIGVRLRFTAHIKVPSAFTEMRTESQLHRCQILPVVTCVRNLCCEAG
jgi:hypothetical protein